MYRIIFIIYMIIIHINLGLKFLLCLNGKCFNFKNTYLDLIDFRSLLNCVPYVLTCQRALRAYALTCQRFLRAYVLTSQRANVSCVLTCSRALRIYIYIEREWEQRATSGAARRCESIVNFVKQEITVTCRLKRCKI